MMGGVVPPGWRDGLYHDSVLSGGVLGRVVDQSKHFYWVDDGNGPSQAKIAGRLLFKMGSESELPVVGDWVLLEHMPPPYHRIKSILPRYRKLSRKVVGKRTNEHVLVSNMDQILVAHSLDATFNIRRLERFVALATDTGCEVGVMLTKLDCCDYLDEVWLAITQSVSSIPLFKANPSTGWGVPSIQSWLRPHHTAVIIGASGVGKTTLINQLTHLNLAIGDVNQKHNKGLHTTTRRQLFQLPNHGGLIIDTPGIREIQLWDLAIGMDRAFSDILDYSTRCHFTNCRHDTEPGCAVQLAIQSGLLSPDRLAHFKKLQSEQQMQVERRQDRPTTIQPFLKKHKKGTNQRK